MDIKKSEEILAEIYRNSQLALESISDILPETEDDDLREELLREHEEYEKISGKATLLARDKGIELKEPGRFKKAMMWSSIKMNTMTDDSRSHIAEMMTQGTVMGITALRTSLSEFEEELADEDILSLTKETLSMEEDFEKKWKAFI